MHIHWSTKPIPKLQQYVTNIHARTLKKTLECGYAANAYARADTDDAGLRTTSQPKHKNQQQKKLRGCWCCFWLPTQQNIKRI